MGFPSYIHAVAGPPHPPSAFDGPATAALPLRYLHGCDHHLAAIIVSYSYLVFIGFGEAGGENVVQVRWVW